MCTPSPLIFLGGLDGHYGYRSRLGMMRPLAGSRRLRPSGVNRLFASFPHDESQLVVLCFASRATSRDHELVVAGSQL
jgi:hypothetical protein